MDLTCHTDPRRDAVRRIEGRNGVDYVELDERDERTLYVYFLGKLPRELAVNRPGIERFLKLEGGERITGIRITDVDPQVQADPERDDYLVVTVDRAGDFSSYTLRLVDVEGIDPRYDRASFRFKLDCPGDVDCRPGCECGPPVLDEPQISYLAKDYASFRQLILDRLAVLMPGWTERHAPDIGITLVELLAYVGDHLSYYQDAVATEAYLGTARQRISVRRHARLVDYHMHEGCNARAWVQLDVSGHVELPTEQVAFITGLNVAQSLRRSVMSMEEVDRLPPGSVEFYEPLPRSSSRTLSLRPAHNRIGFYSWGRRECCLSAGATRATLLDEWVAAPPREGEPPAPNYPGEVGEAPPSTKRVRALDLRRGDVLIFEEVIGPKKGDAADADPERRWAVRLTNVSTAEDPVYEVEWHDGERTQRLPTPVVEIEWRAEDALPFALCLSALGPAPDCAYLTDVSVARGNVVLVDHGRTVPPETLPPVRGTSEPACCECEGRPGDVSVKSSRYRPTLGRTPLLFAERWPRTTPPASTTLIQDARAAVPALSLTDGDGQTWMVQSDLLASGGDDRHFVAEVDNLGRAHLRFGDDELGRGPLVGSGFTARYRVGGGVVGNVGAESISVLVLTKLSVDGVTITARNPLPARGGIDPEPIEEARLLAPAAFRRQIERAITAADYAELAQRDRALQRAAARLAWTGSWYEADVAVDPLGAETADDATLRAVARRLYRYRRMGHDLRVQRAVYVPVKLTMDVCALPGHERGRVRSALLARFGQGTTRGQRGFFHPDELSFGEPVLLSRIVAAAQGVAGVSSVTVTELRRLFEPANYEIANGALPLASNEIAQLDNDPDRPERGQLQITVRGGR